MQIHLLMPFSRHHLWQTLCDHYRSMGVILHPLVFLGETFPEYAGGWVQPFQAPFKQKGTPASSMGTSTISLINSYLESGLIQSDDYYVIVSDDDMYAPGVFDAIHGMRDPVVIISMKRGYRTPPDLPPEKQYPHSTLTAHPDNVEIGSVGSEQIFMKGSLIKGIRLDETSPVADGILAVQLKEKYPIRYEPFLFAWLNYFEPGRWDKRGRGLAFGVMVNDLLRLDMCLKQSAIDPSIPCHTIKNPESAAKGLNKLLDRIEADGDEVAILVHQDMFFRHDWVDTVRAQLAKLPENWAIAGVIGKDMSGRICGRFHDMRIPLHFNTSNLHDFPHPACCVDECVIIVNLKNGFRFDESYAGFDLYGTLGVLQAWESGKSAWVIDAFAEHFCMRKFDWCPDDLFIENYKRLYDKYKGIRVDSTALGLPPDGEVRFETSAAPSPEEVAA